MSTKKLIIEVLDSHTESNPAFGFLSPDQSEVWLNWGEIRNRAKAIAAWLQQAVPAKAPVILLFEPSTDFIVSYLACLYAGCPAVPVPVPKTLAQGQAPEALGSIVKSCGAKGLLTSDMIAPALPLINGLFAKMGLSVKSGTAREAAATPVSEFKRMTIVESDIAMIQHTSGSTSQPSGVLLSHAQMSYMLDALTYVAELSTASRGVVWLPHTHNTGIISFLSGVWSQFPILAMSPLTFVSKPAIWLQAISKFKATVSGAPAFAFDLCVKMIADEDLAAVDLSSWKTAYSGGESMAPRSLKAFAERFANKGFDPSVFLPLYGMSEATLLISGHLPHRFPSVQTINGREVISCGKPINGLDLQIVNPDTLAPLASGQVGEIWAAGPGISHGYVGNEAKTASTFGQSLPGHSGKYLRTGDLGAMFDGELYIVGRIKEIFILQGRKFHAQDIEGSIKEAIPQLQLIPFQLVAIKEPTRECLHMLIEAPEAAIPLLSQAGPNLSKLLSQKHDVPLGDIWILAPNTMPRTEGGKIQRFKAQEMAQDNQLPFIQRVKTTGVKTQATENAATSAPKKSTQASPSLQAISDVISKLLAKELGIDQIDNDQAFVELGLSSLSVYTLSGELEKTFKLTIAPTIFYDYPNITALAQYIQGELSPELKNEGSRSQRSGGVGRESEDIAIVAYACRLPGADDAQEFWKNLNEGVCSISEVPVERWDKNKHYAPLPAQPGKMYTNRGGFLKKSVKWFDPQHFGITPVEATRIDPQQRLMLELCWEAMEHSGTSPQLWRGTRTGVWVGISSSDYMVLQVENGIPGNRYSALGSSHTIAANRLSYTFDLQGPSMALDTACSSSLVSLHIAAESLRRGEVNAAVVGGVNLILSPDLTVVFSEAQMLSPEGLCKSFDDSADGYVRSEGGVVMILKRLSDAKAAGDVIHAVIKGSAVNQDGASNGITAPNRQSQVAVIKEAYQQAKLSPNDVQLIETHGTGTKLGDPIEYAALVEALDGPARSAPMLIGSVKSNVGHLEAAAGLTGLLKLVLSLKEAVVPASLHFKALNQQIAKPRGDLLEIASTRRSWDRPTTGPRTGAISSFGFGGTNVHVIVSEANVEDALTAEPSKDSPVILRLSARSMAALEQNVQQIGRFVASSPKVPLDLLAQVLHHKRADLECRAAIVVQSNVLSSGSSEASRELTAALEKPMSQGAVVKKAGQKISVLSSKVARQTPKLLFAFSGQGTSVPRGAVWLYGQSEVFRSTVDEGLAMLEPALAGKIKSALFSENDSIPSTDVFQPLMYIFQVASFRWLASIGVEATGVLGHSLGELAAATAAGALKFEHGVLVAVGRGHLMQTTPAGKMIVLIGDGTKVPDLVASALRDKPGLALSLAAFNSPKITVVSGSEAAIAEFTARAEGSDFRVRALPVDRAFHSPLMDSILDVFETSLKPLPSNPLTKSFYSTASGKKADTLDAKYWRDQIRQPTRFQAAVEAAEADQYQGIIEIGPDATLSGLITSFAKTELCLPMFEKAVEAKDSLAFLLASLWARGLKIDQSLFEGAYKSATVGRVNASLPPIQYDRKLIWLDLNESGRSASVHKSANSVDMNSIKNLHQIVGDFSSVLSRFIAEEGAVSAKQADVAAKKVPAKTAAAPEERITQAPVSAQVTETAILQQIVKEFGSLIAVKDKDFDVDAPFVELGADSLVMMDALSLLEDRYGVAVPIDRLFTDLNHARAIARFIVAKLGVKDSGAGVSAVIPEATASSEGTVEVNPSSPSEVAPVASASQSPVAAGTSEAEILKQIVTEFSGLIGANAQTFDVDVPFVELGADSLIMMDALASLEDRYGVAVPINRLFSDLNHARAIAKFISDKLQSR
jgi:acyl transferase domain-containing protein/acyl-CoA synthetase (AMP-forming)/AMP-acid ligase II